METQQFQIFASSWLCAYCNVQHLVVMNSQTPHNSHFIHIFIKFVIYELIYSFKYFITIYCLKIKSSIIFIIEPLQLTEILDLNNKKFNI